MIYKSGKWNWLENMVLYCRYLLKAYRSRTGQLYQLLTADVPAPLPDKEHTVRTKYRITKEEHVKEQKRKHILEVPLHCIQCWFPTHDESQRQRNAIP